MFNGKTCYLRPLKLDDVKYLNEWNQKENIMKYLGGGYKPISIDVHKKWIENMIDTSGYSTSKRYMVVEKLSGKDKPVGLIGLYGIEWISKVSTIGLYIAEEDYHGKGLAKEAVDLLEDYANKYLDLRKISLFVVDENKQGIKFWEKVGYKKVGSLKEERFINGHFCDVNIMEKFLK